ncbi:hypothetical protein HGRIS_010164 [Hohenbuehelia grisea]|uniref:DUF676 domain-containing protein n=1 Tax=Hohenbuehelia grisea TaxID=104357 RepID=A0ABR3J411_9AGAR
MSSEPKKSVHLLVLVHGMWGHPGHLSELARIIKERKAEPNEDGVELRVLSAETNRDSSTYDGIDWGGERVADEVMDEIAKLAKDGLKVTHFSITGYSLGGLVSRYVVGILHQRNFFEAVQPVNFNTIATPHVGLPRYPSFISTISSTLGPKLLSRTGEQFYCSDKWSPHGRPLLEVMADPDRIFYQALSLFKNLRIYASAMNDVTVPYVTAAIELDDPFLDAETNGMTIDTDEEYHPIIKSYNIPAEPPVLPPKPTILSAAWFSSVKQSKPLLPPHIMPRFPLNILLYTALPFLIPVGISLALLRFTLDSRSSRARIKLLEAEAASAGMTEREKLIHILARLEREVEEAVEDILEDASAPEPTPSAAMAEPSPAELAQLKSALVELKTEPGVTLQPESALSSDSSRPASTLSDHGPAHLEVPGTNTSSAYQSSNTLNSQNAVSTSGSESTTDTSTKRRHHMWRHHKGKNHCRKGDKSKAGSNSSSDTEDHTGTGAVTPRKGHAILTPVQTKIIARLNTLPLKKSLAYFPNMRNSHGIVVCRDVNRFPVMRGGEGVVRHWADQWVL